MSKFENEDGFEITDKGRLALGLMNMIDDPEYNTIQEIQDILKVLDKEVFPLGGRDMPEKEMKEMIGKIEHIKLKHDKETQ